MTAVTNKATRKAAPEGHVVIDAAGAIRGGAARYLRELRGYLDDVRPPRVDLLGVGRQLTPQWLVKREWNAFPTERRISLNNAGFLNPIGSNITLLGNILQFATRADLDKLAFTPPRRLRAQTPLVHAMARASEVLIVPSTRMAEQVQMVAPRLQEKLTVRSHPVSKPDWAGEKPANPREVLLPIVPSPYKNLDQHISEFLEASEGLTAEPVHLVVPSTSDKFPRLSSHPRVKLIGPQTSEQLEQWWRNCGSVFFPVEFESFGYALAESRVYGRPVIAQDLAQSREIAGHALRPYRRHVDGSLRDAIEFAAAEIPEPDPTPFDPGAYFDWLLSRDDNDV